MKKWKRNWTWWDASQNMFQELLFKVSNFRTVQDFQARSQKQKVNRNLGMVLVSLTQEYKSWTPLSQTHQMTLHLQIHRLSSSSYQMTGRSIQVPLQIKINCRTPTSTHGHLVLQILPKIISLIKNFHKSLTKRKILVIKQQLRNNQ